MSSTNFFNQVTSNLNNQFISKSFNQCKNTLVFVVSLEMFQQLQSTALSSSVLPLTIFFNTSVWGCTVCLFCTLFPMHDAQIMEHGASHYNLSSKGHVLHPQPCFEAGESVFQKTEGLLDEASGSTVGQVEPLPTWVNGITQEWGDKPLFERICAVTKEYSSRKWKLSPCFKRLPKSAFLENPAVVVSTCLWGIYVKNLPLWTSNTQNVNRMRVVAVHVGSFICQRRRHKYMAAIQGPSHWWKSVNVEKVSWEILRICWPPNDIFTKIEDGICYSFDDPANGVAAWTIGIPDCVIGGVCANKSKKGQNLKFWGVSWGR